jgi:hypothetical protein
MTFVAIYIYIYIIHDRLYLYGNEQETYTRIASTILLKYMHHTLTRTVTEGMTSGSRCMIMYIYDICIIYTYTPLVSLNSQSLATLDIFLINIIYALNFR